jgi:hypothetical protein
LKLAAEAESAAADGAGEMWFPKIIGIYEQFAAAISAGFQEYSRGTRTTLGDLIGGTIRLISKEAARELVVCCALSATTFGLAQCRAPLLSASSKSG